MRDAVRARLLEGEADLPAVGRGCGSGAPRELISRNSCLRLAAALLCGLAGIVGPVRAQTSVLEAVQDYFEFAEYSDGSISTDQLASVDSEQVTFIDTRTESQFETGHIPGAMHIEWREVLARRSEIPRDHTAVLYCETGLLSSRAHMALRLAGFENVKVLLGGYREWTAHRADPRDTVLSGSGEAAADASSR